MSLWNKNMFKPIFLDLLNESKMRIFLSIGVSLLIFADLGKCAIFYFISQFYAFLLYFFGLK